MEKILADHEPLPEDWPVHGTTGYRFANLLTGVFVDQAAEARFDRIYQRFTGERASLRRDLALTSRILIMSTTLAAELAMLSHRLARIAAGNRRTRDYTASGLRKALAEIAARFPVYRTYVSARGVSDTDRALHRLGGEGGAAREPHRRPERVRLRARRAHARRRAAGGAAPPGDAATSRMRFQQFTAPVVAKGVEDTAFYRYNRLIALNEVGGDPRNFGFSLKAFHAASEDRAKHWPTPCSRSSTHDTKRSEDVRARLGVLSELARPGCCCCGAGAR